jgi:hypothetical protein
MPKDADPETSLPAARRSRKLARAGLILGILPVVLPWPLWGLELLWIGPIDYATWEQCQNFYCPAAIPWEQLACILILGPSILGSVAAMVCGYIGIIHWPRYPTEKLTLFNVSVALGALWTFIFLIIFSMFFSIAGQTL